MILQSIKRIVCIFKIIIKAVLTYVVIGNYFRFVSFNPNIDITIAIVTGYKIPPRFDSFLLIDFLNLAILPLDCYYVQIVQSF